MLIITCIIDGDLRKINKTSFDKENGSSYPSSKIMDPTETIIHYVV
jgi:hypothetical protein